MLNLCRKFLHVFTLSDLCTADGAFISYDAWNGKQQPWQNQSIRWPFQGKIPPSGWEIWRGALAKCFTKSTTSRQLRRPLGAWIDIPNGWPWYFSPSDDRLYAQRDSAWHFWPRQPIRSTRHAAAKFRSQQAQPCDEPPKDLHLASVHQVRQMLQVVGIAPIPPQATIPSAPQSLVERVSRLDVRRLWALENLVLPADGGRTIAEALKDGTAIAVSDGSFQYGLGTASWVIEGKNSENRIRGDCTIPALPHIHDSYRSEVGGIHGVVIMVELICQQFGIMDGSIIMGCDGKEALHHCVNLSWHIKADKPHFDIVHATRRVISSTPIQWTPKHVKSHQDDDPYAVLDRWATLNVEMDLAAKCHLDAIRHRPTVTAPHGITHEPWALWIGDEKICRDIPERVREHVNGAELLQYWQDKKQFDEHSPSFNWEAIDKALSSSTPMKR